MEDTNKYCEMSKMLVTTKNYLDQSVNSTQILKKLQRELPYYPATPLLSVYSTKISV